MKVYLPPEFVLAAPSQWTELAPGIWGKRVPETVETQTPPWVMEEFRALDAIEAIKERDKESRQREG